LKVGGKHIAEILSGRCYTPTRIQLLIIVEDYFKILKQKEVINKDSHEA